MKATPELSAQEHNLAELQIGSLKVIAMFVGLIGYAWLMAVLWPITGRTARPAAWLGALLLVLSLVPSFAFGRRRLRWGPRMLVGGVLLAVACALLAFRTPGVVCLFILPVMFAGVLLGQRAVFHTAGLAALLATLVGARGLGLPLTSVELWLPIAVMALVTVASWLTARNLYIALEWTWRGYEDAHANELLARRQQAELRRALRALDEATYRLERANHMLTLARDQAEEGRRLKQQFAQTISHELRTPLNLIAGFTELMAQSPEYYGVQLSPTYMRDLSIVHRSACHLQSLVDDVLDLARIEAAQMGLLPEEVDPAALAGEAVNTARSLVEARGLALRAQFEPNLPQLWVDPTRIRQVLFNLLNNAARFTEQGSVSVDVKRHGEDVVFSVADTGMGIAPEHQPRLFEEFQQIDGGRRRRHQGAGLGLAISRRFVELHGGRIWVESTPGQGSVFSFSLPVGRRDPLLPSGVSSAPAGAPQAARAQPEQAGVARESPLLLAVTESTEAAALLSRYVHGCRTVVARDLDQAQEIARRLLPQAVVVDTAQAALDPVGLQQMAQAWGPARSLFFACPLPGRQTLRQRLDVEGYLVKPISRASLEDTLRRLGEDVDRVLVVDDDPDFVRLVERLLATGLRRYQTATAYGGHEALQMLEHERPDLLLLDLVLPDVSGFQVVESIRADPAWRDLRIVIVSGQDDVDMLGPLSGTMLTAKPGGLLPGDVVRWIEQTLGSGSHQGQAVAYPR